PARYDEIVEIETRLTAAEGVRVRFDYAIRRAGGGEELASGFTVHACCGRDGKPIRLPAAIHRLAVEGGGAWTGGGSPPPSPPRWRSRGPPARRRRSRSDRSRCSRRRRRSVAPTTRWRATSSTRPRRFSRRSSSPPRSG